MKLLGNIIYGLFVLLLVAVVGLFLASRMNMSGGIEIKIVKSGSMEPAIHTGSIVLIKPSSDYRAGDVITFGEDSRTEIPTTHRIVSVRNDIGSTFYTTKGDANEEADPGETHASKVIGKVLLTVPYAGYVLDFARQPVGFGLLIGIPAAFIILEGFFTIIKEARAIRRRRRGKMSDIGSGAQNGDEFIDFMEYEVENERYIEDTRALQSQVSRSVMSPPTKLFDGIYPWRKQ